MAEPTCSVEGCDSPPAHVGKCDRHYRRDRYRANRERRLAQNRAWQAANPEKYQASMAKTLAKPEVQQAARDRVAQWRTDHPEWSRENSAKHYAANRERYAELAHAWIEQHPERVSIFKRENHGRYRARKAGNEVEPLDLQSVLDRDGMVCHVCGAPIASLDDLHFDHVIPLSRGGAHSLDNIAPTHALCNLRKGVRPT